MGRVAGVFDNPPGFPCTPPGVDILEGGKLTSNNVAGSSHDPLQSPVVASGAVSKPGGDTAGQDALHSQIYPQQQRLWCSDTGCRQWCSLVFCSEYTVIFFLPSLILTRSRAASHKHHHTH